MNHNLGKITDLHRKRSDRNNSTFATSRKRRRPSYLSSTLVNPKQQTYGPN